MKGLEHQTLVDFTHKNEDWLKDFDSRVLTSGQFVGAREEVPFFLSAAPTSKMTVFM